MNPLENPAGGFPSPSSKKELQLQGPRPPPLRVSKESYKIKKPPLPPPAGAARPPPSLEPEEASQQRQPVIIYSVSPKVIHVQASDFMDVVQRLTGLTRGDDRTSGSGEVSPAARLASIEKTSPTEKERLRSSGGDDAMTEMGGVEVGQFPGILSPAPAALQPIPSEYFSPVIDPDTMSLLHELSPYWPGNSFMGSPSGLLSGSMVSPLPSPDVFKLFD